MESESSNRPAEPDVAARWRDFIHDAGHRLGMFVGQESYDKACALVLGFDLGVGGNTLRRFNEWLSARAPDRPELWFTAQVLREVLRIEAVPATDRLSEDQERQAVAGLFHLLSTFLADQDFERDWTVASGHLAAAAVQLEPRAAVRKIVQDALARGWLITAFQNLVREADDADDAWPPEVTLSLQNAAAALRQETWPRWVDALARHTTA